MDSLSVTNIDIKKYHKCCELLLSDGSELVIGIDSASLEIMICKRLFTYINKYRMIEYMKFINVFLQWVGSKIRIDEKLVGNWLSNYVNQSVHVYGPSCLSIGIDPLEADNLNGGIVRDYRDGYENEKPKLIFHANYHEINVYSKYNEIDINDLPPFDHQIEKKCDIPIDYKPLRTDNIEVCLEWVEKDAIGDIKMDDVEGYMSILFQIYIDDHDFDELSLMKIRKENKNESINKINDIYKSM